jgi:hypothetical protein
MKKENPNLEINITLYENLFPGKSIFQSAAEIFDICRYICDEFYSCVSILFSMKYSSIIYTCGFKENKNIMTV